MGSFGGTRGGGCFIIERGLILLLEIGHIYHSSLQNQGSSLLGLPWYWNDLVDLRAKRRNPTGHITWGGLWSLLLIYFLVGIKILVPPMLSWKMLFAREDLWCFSLNLKNKSTQFIGWSGLFTFTLKAPILKMSSVEILYSEITSDPTVPWSS